MVGEIFMPVHNQSSKKSGCGLASKIDPAPASDLPHPRRNICMLRRCVNCDTEKGHSCNPVHTGGKAAIPAQNPSIAYEPEKTATTVIGPSPAHLVIVDPLTSDSLRRIDLKDHFLVAG